MASVYGLPVSTNNAATISTQSATRGSKRRFGIKSDPTVGVDDEEDDDLLLPMVEEYTVVLSPEERSQRRLAGQPLGRKPPASPFPHANIRHLNRSTTSSNEPDDKSHSATSRSLHLQHLSCMTTILHRCLLNKDYKRAIRAFSLILREEAFGLPIDIRAGGNWGIGAELLLRQNMSAQVETTTGLEAHPSLVPKGYELAKEYYNKLIVQYPPHKAWPEATNSIDFYLAMFNLWIFSTHRHIEMTTSERDRDSMSDDSLDQSEWNDQQPIVRELEIANAIADRMDLCMATVPYLDNSDLIRLRAMVAMWQADLNAECEELQDYITMPSPSLLNENDQPEQNSVSGYKANDISSVKGNFAMQQQQARATTIRLLRRLDELNLQS